MGLFGADYKPLLEHYEKLVQSLRAELSDLKEASLKREGALHDRLMVLTDPAAVRTANSSRRFLGVVKSAPPTFGDAGIPEEFDFPDAPEGLPERSRPRDAGARIMALEADEVARHRAAADARRAAQNPVSKAPSEPQPS